jgi:hypothetical protein
MAAGPGNGVSQRVPEGEGRARRRVASFAVTVPASLGFAVGSTRVSGDADRHFISS